MVALPSTTTTASDSESRIAPGNCSPTTSARFKGRTAISGSLAIERRQEELGEQCAHAWRLNLAVNGSPELGGRRQTLGVPTEMLARHAHAGLRTVVLEHCF